MLTESTDILTVDPEVVFIAHDEIRHCATGKAVVFIYSEPFLRVRSGTDRKRMMGR